MALTGVPVLRPFLRNGAWACRVGLYEGRVRAHTGGLAPSSLLVPVVLRDWGSGPVGPEADRLGCTTLACLPVTEVT